MQDLKIQVEASWVARDHTWDLQTNSLPGFLGPEHLSFSGVPLSHLPTFTIGLISKAILEVAWESPDVRFPEVPCTDDYRVTNLSFLALNKVSLFEPLGLEIWLRIGLTSLILPCPAHIRHHLMLNNT